MQREVDLMANQRIKPLAGAVPATALVFSLIEQVRPLRDRQLWKRPTSLVTGIDRDERQSSANAGLIEVLQVLRVAKQALSDGNGAILRLAVPQAHQLGLDESDQYLIPAAPQTADRIAACAAK